MANSKLGWEYWKVKTDRYQNIKIKKLKKRYKGLGVAIYDYILNEVYRNKGCYMIWTDDICFDVAEYWDESEEMIMEILRYCCDVSLFSKEIFELRGIITSKNIQENFKEWSVASKRKHADIPDFIDIDKLKLPEYSAIIPENPHIILENAGIIKKSGQKRVKSDHFSDETKTPKRVKTPEVCPKTPEESAKLPEECEIIQEVCDNRKNIKEKYKKEKDFSSESPDSENPNPEQPKKIITVAVGLDEAYAVLMQTAASRQLMEKYHLRTLESKFKEFYNFKVSFGEFNGKTPLEIAQHFTRWLPQNLSIDARLQPKSFISPSAQPAN